MRGDSLQTYTDTYKHRLPIEETAVVENILQVYNFWHIFAMWNNENYNQDSQ